MAPREIYSAVIGRLRALRDLPGPSVGLVVVDEARCPRRVRQAVADFTAAHDALHVTIDHRAGANECRMAGLARVTTPFTLFLDNDATVRRGALEALLDRARTTDASFVAPVCLNRDGTIHYAGTIAHAEEHEGRRDLVEINPRGHPPADELLPHLSAERTGAPELHGVLVRTASLRDVGGLDAELLSSMDCIDLGFRLQDVAGGGWLEPAATVAYDNPIPRPSDLPLFLDRWSRSTIGHDLERFATVWDIDQRSPRLLKHWLSLGPRRFRHVRYLRGALRRTLGDTAVARFDRAFDAVSERVVRPTVSIGRPASTGSSRRGPRGVDRSRTSQ